MINKQVKSIPFPYNRKNINVNNMIDFKLNLKIANIVLSDLFQNIIINAFKYSFQGSSITIYSKIKSNSIRIYIKNDGLKIRDDELIDIFKHGYRGYETKNFQEKIDENIVDYKAKDDENLGIGLYTCQELMNKVLSGELSIEIEKSKYQNGSINTFELSFPNTFKVEKKR